MIEVRNLSYKYPGSDSFSLHDISLDIKFGQALSFMGSNGSGKTTFARCLNGLFLPTEGSVSINGLKSDNEKKNNQIRQLVGMVFQNPDNQIVSTTVEREIAFGMENLNIPYSQMVNDVNKLLNYFNLEHYRIRSPHYLSGGEKQLLAIAAVLAMEPSYLIFDEPTSLLDPYSRRKILETVFKNSNGCFKKITPILITQYPEETFYTDRLIILDLGKIVFDDSPQNVFKHKEELEKIGIGVPVEYQLNKIHFHEN